MTRTQPDTVEVFVTPYGEPTTTLQFANTTVALDYIDAIAIKAGRVAREGLDTWNLDHTVYVLKVTCHCGDADCPNTEPAHSDHAEAKAAVARASELLAQAARELTIAATYTGAGTTGNMHDNTLGALTRACGELHNARGDVQDAGHYLAGN